MKKKHQRLCGITRPHIMKFAKPYFVTVLRCCYILTLKECVNFFGTHSKGYAGMKEDRNTNDQKKNDPPGFTADPENHFYGMLRSFLYWALLRRTSDATLMSLSYLNPDSTLPFSRWYRETISSSSNILISSLWSTNSFFLLSAIRAET